MGFAENFEDVLIWQRSRVLTNEIYDAMGAILLTGFAIGLALTPIAGLYGDIGRGIPIIAQFWMLRGVGWFEVEIFDFKTGRQSETPYSLS